MGLELAASDAGPPPAEARRRLFLIAIGLFAPIILIWFVAATIVAHGLQFPPALPYSTSGPINSGKPSAPDAQPLSELIDAPSEEITLEQTGEHPLRALLAPAVPAKSAVILIYPNRVDRQSLAAYFKAIRGAGYPVLVIDYADSRAGSGFGWKERSDVIAAIAALRSHGVQETAALGISDGAAAAVCAAADGARLSAIVSDSSYAKLKALLARIPPMDSLNPLFDRTVSWELGLMLGNAIDRVAPARAAAKIGNCPLMVINGADDPLVRPSDAREIFASATGPKELWIVPAAGHAAALAVQPEQYRKRVDTFLAHYLGAPS
jgi:pimeloyl-ACP methyl ester carboxylesterase